jgi:hypothetical protein
VKKPLTAAVKVASPQQKSQSPQQKAQPKLVSQAAANATLLSKKVPEPEEEDEEIDDDEFGQ